MRYAAETTVGRIRQMAYLEDMSLIRVLQRTMKTIMARQA